MTDANRRAAALKGAMAAQRLHRTLDSRGGLARGSGSVDVFGAVARLGVTLLLRPLDGLLGAYLPEPAPGVLVTTRRALGVQRFTAAHELGHHVLKHGRSLDGDDILRRPPLGEAAGRDARELEADAFAAGFLLPRWLIAWHADRQGWRGDRLTDPHVVYQLSLRLGASYEATWRTLTGYGLVAPGAARALGRTRVRDLKAQLLEGYRPVDYRRDVWLVTERDAGASIVGSRRDLFVFRLEEHSGGGYLWDAGDLERSGFSVLNDMRKAADGDGVGSPTFRTFTAATGEAHLGRVSLDERRPWRSGPPLSRLELDYDLTGPEVEGYSRAERRRTLEAA